MIHFLAASVARIYAHNGDVVGAGVLVDEQQVLTCAHVVDDALSLSSNQSLPPDAQVQLDFPLLTESSAGVATVAHFNMEADVAGLQLIDPPPRSTRPTRLVSTDSLWRHAFGAVGFPAGYDTGVWASGILLGRIADGRVQLEDVKVPGYAVQGGFSGTPVWDEQVDGVVGIVVAAESDSSIKSAFMVPTARLIEAWPALAAHSLAAGSREHLLAQLTRLEEAQHQAINTARFQSQIDTLRRRLAKWDNRIERQRERITEGLEAQRQQMAPQRAQSRKHRLRVVGSPPLDVTDYFKDRRQDLRELGQLLSEPTTRLVSVIGHGGMGKTALACKVLRDLEHQRWPYTDHNVAIDGIVYLSTRTTGISLERLFLDCTKLLEDEERERLRTVWTNPQLKTADKINRLLETLRQGRYVILLDNLEDLLDDQGRFTDEDLRLFFEQDLLRAPGTQLVVTTRIPLALHREIMRFDQKVELLEGLPVDEGVALLRELDPNGDYGLRDAPEAQLKKAVELTHGVPRALEVLAGILANDPFATLDEVLETFYAHEDVVRALIEEHYKRLDQDARRVIEALAVFKRPVPPIAVDFLLEPFEPGLDVPSIVQRLIRANIVSVDRATKMITLHPIDQDYAYSQLPEESEIDADYTGQALERRAADYYVEIRAPEETWKSIDDLEPQLNEFEHRVRAGDHDEACRLVKLIDFDFLFLWGHYTRLIEMREKIKDNVKDPRLQIANLGPLGRAYYISGQYDQAIKLYELNIEKAQQIGDDKSRGFWLSNLGNVYYACGKFKKSLALHRKSLTIAEKTGYLWLKELSLGRSGISLRNLGKFEQAIEMYEQALDLAREIGDHRYESVWLGHLGVVFHDLGQIAKAISLYRESLELSDNLGDRRWVGIQLGNLGRAYYALGDFERAIEYHEQALDVAREIGALREENNHLGNLGRVYHHMGQAQHAIELYQRALQIAQQIGDRQGQTQHLGSLGRIYHAVGKDRYAITYHTKALNIACQIDSQTGQEQQLRLLGITYYDLGQLDRSLEYHRKALSIARKIGVQKRVGLHLGDLGGVFRRLGKIERGINFHNKAAHIAHDVGSLDEEGLWLYNKGLDYLMLGKIEQAINMFNNSYQIGDKTKDPQLKIASLLRLGIAFLITHDSTAKDVFEDAGNRCREILSHITSFFEPNYALALALIGKSACDPRWQDEGARTKLLVQALTHYQHALEITAAPGIVQDAIRDLELIQAAGVKGLEPVFELLESAEYKPDIPENLPDLESLIVS